jgi:hypothetical protein
VSGSSTHEDDVEDEKEEVEVAEDEGVGHHEEGYEAYCCSIRFVRLVKPGGLVELVGLGAV